MAYAMWGWVVKNHLLKRLQRQMHSLFVFSLVMAASCTMVPLCLHSFGTKENITCWLEHLSLTDPSVILNKVNRKKGTMGKERGCSDNSC